MANPYEPPRAKAGEASAPQIVEAPPSDVTYELEPADASAAARARHGYGGYWIVSLIANVVFNAMNRTWKVSPGGLLCAAIVAIYQLGPLIAARAVRGMSAEQRRLRLSFSPDVLTVTDGARAEKRIVWSSFKRRESRERMFLEQTNGTTYTVPRRAFASDGEFMRVQSYVAARVNETKSFFSARNAILLWVVLIVVFVAIWSFFSDVPPHR